MAFCPLPTHWIFLYFCLPVRQPTCLCPQPYLPSALLREDTSQCKKATGVGENSLSGKQAKKTEIGMRASRAEGMTWLKASLPYSPSLPQAPGAPSRAVSHYPTHLQDCSAPGTMVSEMPVTPRVPSMTGTWGSLRFLPCKIKLIGFTFPGPGKIQQVFSGW